MNLSSTYYKQLSREELDAIFQGVKFPTQPYLHQLAFLAWAKEQARPMCWLDIGTGKTLCALYLAALWRSKRTLVVCPNSVTGSWATEAKTHTHRSIEIISGPTAYRRERIEESRADILVVNYEGLKMLWAERRPRRDGKEGSQYVMLPVRPPDDITCVVVDEVHHLKDPSSLQTKIIFELSHRVPHVIGLTGTPVRNLEDLWAQFYALDVGKTLGSNYYSFLNTYFRKAFYKWRPLPGSREKILERIAPATMRYSRAECLDLPPATYELRTVDPSSEQLALSRQLAGEIQSIFDMGELNKLAASNYMLDLSRVSGGFVKHANGELKRLKTNHKLDELLRILQWEVPADSQVIVSHHFVEEGRLICAALKKAKIPHAALRGEIKDKQTELDRFKSGEAKVMVANPRCGGEGLNLQNANICIFYSYYAEGAISRQQMEGRIYRANQTKPCLFIDLVVKDLVDKDVVDAARSGVDFSDRILDWIGAGGLKGLSE